MVKWAKGQTAAAVTRPTSTPRGGRPEREAASSSRGVSGGVRKSGAVP